MKILWLCNSRFSNKDLCSTGTWLQPLAEMINKCDGVDVVNVTMGSEDSTLKEVIKDIVQYVLPNKKCNYYLGDEIQKIIDIENPDLIHIWGTETGWGALVKQRNIRVPSFIEMQGVTSSIPMFYWGGLSAFDILKVTMAPLSFCNPRSTSLYERHLLVKKGENEKRIIRDFGSISVQSNWVRDYVLNINPNAKIYKTQIILRNAFYECAHWQWKENSDSPVIFSLSNGGRPYKGVHVLLPAIALLKKKYPKIQLNVAGNYFGSNRPFFYRDYVRYILSIIKRLGIEENVRFVGPLNSTQIIKQLQNANVCVIPSFVESYCLALAEAMMVGTPCVVSYAGAMPEMAEPNSEALFYSSNDYISCAARIEECLSNRHLSESLSSNAIKRKQKDCNKDEMIKIQIRNYKDFLSDNNKGRKL